MFGSLTAQAQTIDTVMGGSDNVPITAFTLTWPNSPLTDADGNIFISTGRLSQTVFKYTRSTSVVTRFAGNGQFGSDGDGGQANVASLDSPDGMAMDAAGNLYIADSGNDRVRKVAPDGVITTIAGAGVAGLTLTSPGLLFLDGKGALYIANTSTTNPRSVIKLDLATGVPTTIFSDNSVVKSIGGMVVDSKGNLFVSDWLNPCVYRYDAATSARTIYAGTCTSSTGTKSTLHSNVDPLSVQLVFPRSLAMDAQDNLYLVDQSLYTISKIDAATRKLSVIAGFGNRSYLVDPNDYYDQYDGEYAGNGTPALNARFMKIGGIYFDRIRNHLAIVDYGNAMLRLIDENGIINTLVGESGSSGGALTGTQVKLYKPRGIAFDSLGNLHVADQGNSAVKALAVTPATGLVDKANVVSNTATSPSPLGIAFNAQNALFLGDVSKNQIFTMASGASALTLFGGTGNLGSSGDGNAATQATMRSPDAMVVDRFGNLLFSDWQNHTIRKIAVDGKISTVVGKGWTGDFVDGPGSDARLVFPTGLALDADGNLYIADSTNNAVRKVAAINGEITAASEVTTLAGKGLGNFGYTGDNGPAKDALLNTPTGVSVDAMGNIYVVDSGNAVVRMISGQTGIISTIAGGGSNGMGDGGPAIDAQFANPQYSALDKAGNLYVSDLATGRVRKITFASPDAPTGTAVAGDAMATVSFAPPANMGGGSPTRFVVHYTNPNNTTPVQGCDVAAFDTSGSPVTSCEVTGLTNGTPYTFTVTITNSLAMTSAPSANIGPVTPWQVLGFVAPAAQTAEVGIAVSLTLQATGGSQDFNYTVIGGALPDGLTLAADGSIIGKPTKAASFSATVQVEDRKTGKKLSVTVTFTVSRGQQALAILSTAPASPRLGSTYTVNVQAGPSSAQVVLGASGACSSSGFVVTFNVAGDCKITVSQKGDTQYLDATDQVQSIKVGQGASGVSVSSTPNPSKPGEEVTFTVNVAFDLTKQRAVAGTMKAAPTPTGTVTLMDGSDSLGTVPLDGLGVAMLSVKIVKPVGDHNIVANYSGDANFPATQSAVHLHTVAAVLATPVPTLGQWAVWLLTGLLAGLAALNARGRKHA
ncbi:IPTL-CTERM sorting domain-containing protein [Diaphorobacter sp. HDW4B]|uniref:IPTL-CTERM sorting domain-containing protein n=1 Tax=Diaphorobacter sp. HDW4B TaxID=2714925 RepID=UPI00140D7217|nr:IPTL-CTERM sorting domain-containing protein [Diaphorobacter sp. HDW4B]QIL72439.1 IPTL-CTERM sorting domain-containing protein [Diaphorobacter sp. HDW4B]